MNVLLIVANILELISLFLEILCVGLPYWYGAGSGSATIYFGLWEYCASVSDDYYVCRSYGAAGTSAADWMAATAGLEVLTMVLVFFALFAGCAALCCLKYNAVLYIIAAILAFFAALSGTVALIVFGSKFGDGNPLDGNDLHASFYLAIFGAFFSLLAGIIYLLAKPKSAIKSFEQLD